MGSAGFRSIASCLNLGEAGAGFAGLPEGQYNETDEDHDGNRVGGHDGVGVFSKIGHDVSFGECRGEVSSNARAK